LRAINVPSGGLPEHRIFDSIQKAQNADKATATISAANKIAAHMILS